MKLDPRAEETARRIHRRGKIQKANFLSGPKVKGLIQTESVLEATLVCAAMIDPRVVEIRPQPCTFDLNTGRRHRTKDELMRGHCGSGYKPAPFTPDFFLRLTGARELYIETKPERILAQKPEVEALPEQLAGFGFELRILTDATLTDTVAHNARQLRPYVGRTLAPDSARGIESFGPGPFRFGDALDDGHGQGDLLVAVLTGVLAADVAGTRLGRRTELRAAAGRRDHLEILPL